MAEDWGNVDTSEWAAQLAATREEKKAEKEAAKAAKQVAKAHSGTKVAAVAAPAQATPVANDNTTKKSTATKSSRPTKRGGKELNFSGENVEAKKQKKTPHDEYDKAALQQKAEELEAKRKEKKQINSPEPQKRAKQKDRTPAVVKTVDEKKGGPEALQYTPKLGTPTPPAASLGASATKSTKTKSAAKANARAAQVASKVPAPEAPTTAESAKEEKKKKKKKKKKQDEKSTFIWSDESIKGDDINRKIMEGMQFLDTRLAAIEASMEKVLQRLPSSFV